MALGKKSFVRIILSVIGAVLCGYTIVLLSVNNLNLGNALPGLLGTPLLLYGIFYRRINILFRKTAGKIVKWIFCCGYIFLAALFLVFTIQTKLQIVEEPPKNADAVLVLGAALKGWQPSDTLAARLDTAIAYANENPDSIFIVSGGKGPQEEISEADAMRAYLIEHGIDESRILIEDQAESTRENFVNSKIILDEYFGGQSYTTVFVTNDYHILRADINARKAGFENVYPLAYRTRIYTAPPAYMRESLAMLAALAFGA